MISGVWYSIASASGVSSEALATIVIGDLYRVTAYFKTSYAGCQIVVHDKTVPEGGRLALRLVRSAAGAVVADVAVSWSDTSADASSIVPAVTLSGAKGFVTESGGVSVGGGLMCIVGDLAVSSSPGTGGGGSGEGGMTGWNGLFVPHYNEQGELTSIEALAGFWTKSFISAGGLNGAAGGGPSEIPVASASVLGGVKVGQNLTISDEGVLDAHIGLESIPIATSSVLGGVKVGENLSVTKEGVLSADTGLKSLPVATTTVLGGVKVGNNLTVTKDGMLHAKGGLETLPIATASVLGGVKVGANLNISAAGVLSAKDSLESLPVATAEVLGGVKVGSGLAITEDGLLSANGDEWKKLFIPHYNESGKLTSIEALAGFWSNSFVSAGGLNAEATGGTGGLSEIPVASEDTLGGVKVGANLSIDSDGTLNALTEIPIASASVLGAVKVGENLSVSEDGTLSATGGGESDPLALTYDDATSSWAKGRIIVASTNDAAKYGYKTKAIAPDSTITASSTGFPTSAAVYKLCQSGTGEVKWSDLGTTSTEKKISGSYLKIGSGSTNALYADGTGALWVDKSSIGGTTSGVSQTYVDSHLAGRTISTSKPTTGQVVYWTGTQFAYKTITEGSSSGTGGMTETAADAKYLKKTVEDTATAKQTFEQGIRIGTSSSGVDITYDASAQALKIDGNLYAVQAITAGGSATDGNAELNAAIDALEARIAQLEARIAQLEGQ